MRLCIALVVLFPFSIPAAAQPQQGQGDPQDPPILRTSAEQQRKGAEQGDAKAQAQLGFSYRLGLGVKKDEVEAAKWYLKAAEQGHLLSQSILGQMYRDGEGIPKNSSEAAKWYRKAAENDAVEPGESAIKARAQEQMGTLYEKGLGVLQDYAEAAKWYRKSVEGGWDEAAFFLYFLCRDGKATKQDCIDVANWLSILAKQDDSALSPFTKSYLGTLYEKGLGVPQDYVEAASWYRKASDQGNSMAQFSLAGLYLAGRGVPQDFVAAHMWLNLAASLETNGEIQKGFADERDELAKEMTPAQIAEAQRLAREWKPTKAK
jgi:TPR repeat protein